MKAKIRTCPFDNLPCDPGCFDRHPDRSGCALTDALDAGQDVLTFNNPTGEVLVFFRDGRVWEPPAIIAGCTRADLERLLFPEKTHVDTDFMGRR